MANNFEPDLVDLIDTRITGINQKPWPFRLDKKGVLPAIVYQPISDAPNMKHDGPDGYRTDRVQFSFLAETYAGVLSLRNEFEGELNGFSGTHGSTKFFLWDLANSRPNPGGDDLNDYWIQDYLITYKPA